jgi:NAD(P)H-dependent flavin oxidoreductase YrpB (nitropropane dioxygenase family)
MVAVLLEELNDLEDVHVLFAGGVHDATSAAMVSTITAPLARRGARVGALMGTAYLFTEEAVRDGAITARFQEAAVAGDDTVLLESGPGHATRCLPSPYVGEFGAERHRLLAEGLPAPELRERLEALNIGRLRVASKGTRREGDDLVDVAPEDQWRDGMYMIGQVAALHDRVRPLRALHDGRDRGLRAAARRARGAGRPARRPLPPARRTSRSSASGRSSPARPTRRPSGTTSCARSTP